MSGALRIAAVVAIGAVLVAALVVAFLARPGVEAASTVLPGVMIECGASVSVSADACGAWGDSLLTDGPPSTTFEMDDLERVSLERELWGLGGTCSAAYFIGRYPTDAVWTDEVPCISDG